jgi:lycopene beta-cyclase
VQENNKYNFIIAGMGCAGLSMAIQLKQSSVEFNKVLLIDKEPKDKNDRTWCFWTKEKTNWFNPIVFRRWENFTFKSHAFKKSFLLSPYNYLMIRGIDFYTYCLNELKNDSRFEIIYSDIKKISSTNTEAFIETKNNTYCADYLFNSAVLSQNKKPHHINYVQHFKGWVVETDANSFNETSPVFMDFDTEQHNDCRFFYVIPFAKNKALVEYTGFSKNKLPDTDYEAALKNYLKNKLNISAYTIIETETGEIPMMESEFVNPFGNRVINIGTAAGSSKPSTGYTFYFIQRNLKIIISQLEKNKTIKAVKRKFRFSFYDKILLDVLDKKNILASEIFTRLFQKNKTTNLLSFLNEESSIIQDLSIMNSVPKIEFSRAAFSKLKK